MSFLHLRSLVCAFRLLLREWVVCAHRVFEGSSLLLVLIGCCCFCVFHQGSRGVDCGNRVTKVKRVPCEINDSSKIRSRITTPIFSRIQPREGMPKTTLNRNKEQGARKENHTGTMDIPLFLLSSSYPRGQRQDHDKPGKLIPILNDGRRWDHTINKHGVRIDEEIQDGHVDHNPTGLFVYNGALVRLSSR